VKKWAIIIASLLGVLISADSASAQELEPRIYAPAPVGTTIVLAGVGGSKGGILLDPCGAAHLTAAASRPDNDRPTLLASPASDLHSSDQRDSGIARCESHAPCEDVGGLRSDWQVG
jgi:hypothetical protein